VIDSSGAAEAVVKWARKKSLTVTKLLQVRVRRES
jgi:hypothetical protein